MVWFLFLAIFIYRDSKKDWNAECGFVWVMVENYGTSEKYHRNFKNKENAIRLFNTHLQEALFIFWMEMNQVTAS